MSTSAVLTPTGVCFGGEDLQAPEVHLHLTEPGCHITNMFCHTEIAPSSLVASVCTYQGSEHLLIQPQPAGKTTSYFHFIGRAGLHKSFTLCPLLPPSFSLSIYRCDCFLSELHVFCKGKTLLFPVIKW